MDHRNLTKGVIKDVFYPRGTNPVTGKTKFLKAPFQILRFQTEDGPMEDYVMPRSLIDDPAQVYADDTMTEKNWMGWEDFGYHDLDPIVLDESEMGDWQGHPDDWRGFHSFGFI